MVTLDSNVAVYAFSDVGEKSRIAGGVLSRAAFVSVQVLNEFASVASRKQRKSWPEVASKLADIRETVPDILPISDSASIDALRIAERYRLNFYDGLMLAVALSGGARTIYSEDMQHNLLIDGALRVVNPFRAGVLA